jgi:acyl-CoA synthetase (AMP-forming)/AMP-acid ligase II/acyl carrier protein
MNRTGQVLERDPAARLRSSSSLVDILRWRAEHEPNRVAYTFLEDGGEASQSLTYASLDHRARVVAGYLLEQGGAGERALLLYPPGLEFLVALFGCLYAGVIAVPLYPPKLNRRDSRCIDVSVDARARFALTTSAVLEGIDRVLRHSSELAALRWIAPEALPADAAPDRVRDRVEPDSLAYLQYTSGSTRAPKGVMVSHGNLLANIDDIHRGFEHDEGSVPVSWLPHFHDMGLVYGLLSPLALGFRCYFMPPAAFLQKPVRWLQAISRLGGTHSGGPNFGYELCAQRITPEQKQGLDLRRWTVAFNGAEPVRRETLQKFAQTFADCGFSARALCPAYGLAEATLKVTTGRPVDDSTFFVASASGLRRGQVMEAPEPDADGKALVGCGAPLPGTEVLIVHPDTLTPCATDQVGEIWVNSPSVAQGYWNRPEESALVFRAAPAGDGGSSRFLRTGDLGFLSAGHLFVTGRIKDLIIIRGRNHYPHDVELTVQNSHPALRVDAGAAVSVDVDGEERLVVIQEIDRHRLDDAENAVALIRTAIAEEHEIAPYAIVLVRQNGVPKTSSGKIQRTLCAQAFAEGRLPVVCEWRDWKESTIAGSEEADMAVPRSREDIQDFLLRRLAHVLSLVPDEVDVSEPFNSFGLDSLRTLTLVGDMEKWLGHPVSPTLFWNYPTIADLAAHLAEARAEQAAAGDGRG